MQKLWLMAWRKGRCVPNALLAIAETFPSSTIRQLSQFGNFPVHQFPSSPVPQFPSPTLVFIAMNFQMTYKILKPRQALNKAFLKVKPVRSEIEVLKINLVRLMDQINEAESE